MVTPRALRLVAASFLGGALLAFVALAPWSRGALSSGISSEAVPLPSSQLAADSSVPEEYALAQAMALDAAAQAYAEAYVENQTAIYL